VTAEVKIMRLERKLPPVISAEWNGKPVAIRLDSSAVLKLEGSKEFRDFECVLNEAPERITRAAQRILEMRKAEADQVRLEVVLSALDLD
jgi:hypothetical protein